MEENVDDASPHKYQVSIRIIQAKHLAGIDLDPYVRLNVGREAKQTRVKKSTAAPTFEEDFFFDFQLTPAVFYDQIIKLQVFSAARLFRRRKPVGEFQIDAGTVFNQPGHYFFEKWALLVDPKEPLSAPKGYLLCSIVIETPTQVAKLPHSTREVVEEDIENNLLIPETFKGWPGERDPAHYMVTIYRAEDLPNSAGHGIMASMKKALKSNTEVINYVDPFVSVVFAGMRAKTSVVKDCANPTWNERITFCEMFPTFSESIRLHVRDSDQGVIATSILDFRIISDSSVEDGYPPTFGPSYVNLYGSFRGNVEPNPMNYGLAEGVAYRGRLLLSIDVEPTQDEKKKITLHKSETKATKFGPDGFNDTKEKYFLFCCILDASMLDKCLDGRSVHFELSIGKHGTTEYSNECSVRPHRERQLSTSNVAFSDDDGVADETELLVETSFDTGIQDPYKAVFEDESGCKWRSCTPPCVAVADEHYCSIQYGVKKPCMFVISEWEDYTYRYLHVNQLSQLTNTFERKLDNAGRSLEMGLEKDARLLLRQACDTLITAFSEYTSYLESEFQDDLWHTELDKEKSKQRRREIDRLAKWCREFRVQVMHPASDVRKDLDLATVQLNTLKILSNEPQEVMPDIFLWLISGNRRVAYRRFKPYELMYSESRQERGSLCGKVQNFFLKVPGSSMSGDDDQYPIWGYVTAYFWLGRNVDKSGYLSGLPKAKPLEYNKSENDPDYIPPKHMHYKETHIYELRCHIYQGRSLMPSDESGLSDPFARVIFCGNVQQTQIIEQSVNPIWDECLIMPKVELLGTTNYVKKNPPTIIMQVYDYDKDGTYEFIGLAEAHPVVKLAQEPYSGPDFPPKLRWWPLCKSYHRVGEILATFELIQLHKDMIDYNKAPSAENTDVGPIIPIPQSIRPKLTKYQIQVMFWGIRDLKIGSKFFKNIKPIIEIECAGMVLESDPIKDYGKFQNFTSIIKIIDVDLPEEPMYQPPIIIRCVEKKSFGRSTLLGSTTIPTLSAFLCEEEKEEESVVIEHEDGNEEMSELFEEGTGVNEDKSEEKQLVMSYQQSLLTEEDEHIEEGQDYEIGDDQEEIDLEDDQAEDNPDDQPAEIELPDSLVIIDEEKAEYRTGGSQSQTKTSSITSAPVPAKRQATGVDNVAFLEETDDEETQKRSKKKRPDEEAAGQGRKASVAAHVAGKSAPEKTMEESLQQAKIRRQKRPDVVLDWWSKYYASIQAEEKEKSQIDRVTDISNKTVKFFKKKASKLKAKMVDAATNLPSNAKNKRRVAFQKKQDLDLDENMMEIQKKMNIAKLTLYREELENQPEFHHFQDCFDVYRLYKGKRTFADFDDLNRTVGKFKGRLSVLKHPIDPHMPSPFPDLINEKQELIIRVYIIKARFLAQTGDVGGLADPYLIVNLGKQKVSDRAHKIFGQLNPTFGRMFEFNACLPEDYELTVQVWDWDRVTRDDIMGETKIDVEQRFYTKHRAICGLAKTYDNVGYNAWRDCERPTHILSQLCKKHSLPNPVYTHHHVKIGGITFDIPKVVEKEQKKNDKAMKKEDKNKLNAVQDKSPIVNKENLALVALHNTKNIPGIGYDLVPEHVETRTLYLPDKPGVSQGSIEMWVDIFPKDANVMQPIDIKPRKPKSYELRVIVYDTKNVILDDYNVLTGLSTVDQYVKGFIAGPDIDGQETDTHYRSLKGEGNFNWRFAFKFDYSDIENKIIHKTKHSALALNYHEEKIPPVLHLQVWDADEITSDDYLGEATFNLTKMPRGAKSSGSCDVKIMNRSDTINLFSKHSRRVRAWWPFIRRETDGTEILAGKVDLMFELLTDEDALRKPAGKGHEAPDAMPEPVRPETSFAWFTSPLKFLKYTVWLGMRWRILLCFIVFLLIIFLLVFIYELPRAGAGKLVQG